MIITHTQRKEGEQWEEFDGRTNWTHSDFKSRSWPDHAYKFSNGDIWDKVGGRRDPMGWSSDIIVPRIDGVDYNKLSSDLVKNAMEIRDPIFGFLDAGRQKVNHGVVAYYEPPKRTTAGIIPIIEAYQEQFDIRSTDYKFDEFIDTMTQIIIGEELCSRHLWQ